MDALQMYRSMRRIRSFEERTVELFRAGKLYGTIHACIGQEAVAVGTLIDTTPSDLVTGTHRSHGHCIAKGAELTPMMLELFGRKGGYGGGKGGSMHVADLNSGMLGANGLVGAGIPQAAGAAMAAGLRREGAVAIAFMGDGAANQGVFYETVNLAVVWGLPLVIVCENNRYALSARYEDTQSTPNVTERVAGFGLPAEVVDGMDVAAVREAAGRAIERARRGEGPSFIECMTYRFQGHSARNERPKRPDDEVAAWMARDPLASLRRSLVKRQGVDVAEIDAVDAEVQRELQLAEDIATAATVPDLEAADDEVYSRASYLQTPAPRSAANEKRQVSTSVALNEALHQEMEADGRVILLGEDVAQSGGLFQVTQRLLERFGPLRVRDTPISEQAITGMAVGLALSGMRPVIEIQFMDILTLAMDQIVNQAAKLRYMLGGKPSVPMVVRAPLGAGINLAAQHSQSLETWFMHVPGLKVVAPSSPYDAKGLLASAIRDPNPVIFLEHKLLYFLSGPVPAEPYSLPLGVADIRREGTDVTVVATSAMVRKAEQAARKLAREGISVEVVDPRTLLPLDFDTILRSVRKTGRLVVVHEACRFAGFGGEIVAEVTERAFGLLRAGPIRIGAPFSPVPFNAELEQAFIPGENDIIEAARRVVFGEPAPASVKEEIA
jgi:pyruvate/2-oxoglutarate/acetoin dehydrogenase E1 component/TPP-dependent pyruvate/acetoin dehydrogenase alpha subunit